MRIPFVVLALLVAESREFFRVPPRLAFRRRHCKQETEAARARKDLFCAHDKYEITKNETVFVQLDILLKYFTYDMHQSKMTTNTWLSLSWTDKTLAWDPETKNNIQSFYVSSDEIWYPDLAYRSDYGNRPSVFNSEDCTLTAGGNVTCLIPTRIEGLCLSRLRKFPYDVQNCSLKMSSWLQTGEKLFFRTGTPAVRTENYVENTEWKLREVQLFHNPGNFSCCPHETFPSMEFSFIIERHSAAHVCMVVFPILAIIVTTLMTFCLSPDETERLILIFSNSLNHLFYVQYIYWRLPIGGADPPLILIYARDSFLLALFSLVLTVGQRRLIKSSAKSPVWMNKFVVKISSSRLGKYLMIFNESHKNVALIEEEEDGEAIIEETVGEAKGQDWLSFSRILDRILLVVYTAIYFSMFVNFLI